MHQELHKFPQAQMGKGHQVHADIFELIRTPNNNSRKKYERESRKSIIDYTSQLPVLWEEECQRQALMQQAWEFVRAKSADKYRYEIDKIEALFTINLGPAIYVWYYTWK